MASYKEQDFETHIVEHLTDPTHGDGAYVQRASSDYDKELCLIPEEIIAFVKATQPEEYEKLQEQYGADAGRNLCIRIRNTIRRWGALRVLREGVKDRGATIQLVYFRPSSTLNPAHEQLYRKNRLSVVRQLHYSTKHPSRSLDLGIFVNGIPIFTAELKNSLTGQFVEQAKKQYRKKRRPPEPLFQFKRCLAHFAVGNEKVFYTTRLAGDDTYFLPFNKGIENPTNPDGHKTAYLWETVWHKDSLLDLLQNYLCMQIDKEKVYDPEKGAIVTKESETLIFPRYHQLDVVRKLLRAAREDRAGHNYLVQHSAGSGKSNSIAWLSHGLRQLYRSGEKERLFDTIIVVTDRRVLDEQLQNTIKQFEQTAGTVVPITKTSQQLKEALEKGKDILITTIQKFPVISEAMSELEGNRFAVVVDEAHSGQTGENAKHLKKTLSASLDEAEEKDETDVDLEDEIVQEIRARGQQAHISYFAFTATPKNKTLELFGRKNEEGTYVPFHVYSMRQAIKERFILDVLDNYITFKRYFKLVKSIDEDKEYETRKAARALTSYVDLQPHAINTKANICLDHFLDVTADAINGKGRAMLVTRSRLHCVRYYLTLKRLMKERGLSVEPLVAFSGTVEDPDTGAKYTESSLNELGSKTDIRDAFKLPKYRILIVANKFQTGFDCPPLHTMWVDKKLGGVSAVQTLSRLNRTMWSEGKTEVVVLDFVNEAEAIQTAFQDFYQTTFLGEETDPNKLYDLAAELRNLEVYTPQDVDDFAEVFFDESQPGEQLQPILDRVVQQWRQRDEETREDFRSLLQSFARLYGYVGQLIDFEDPDLEKLYVFARNLNRKLPPREGGGLPQEILDEVDLDSFRIQETYDGSLSLNPQDGEVQGISTTTSGQASDAEREYLSNIVSALNEAYGLDLSERDKIRVKEIVEDVETDDSVEAVMTGPNSRSNKRHHVNKVIEQKVMAQVNHSIELFQRLNDHEVKKEFKRRLFNQLLQQFG
ncbi:MAG: DEAD/DEAH box helicase family protein [Longimonas sp.]|uniref:type I restriction endonuclease subunit R n=1 Tax=Longimonas sp. TaxID=2039626 RepID=UPI003349E6CA